jgi:EmrB/QacA subfamily drug resistance transporter
MTAQVPLRSRRAESTPSTNLLHRGYNPRIRGERASLNTKAVMSERNHTNRWLVLVIVCVAQFMVVLDATIVNVALPSIQHGLHFSASSLQWIVNAYTLVFGGFLLLGGRAADLFGRQLLFIAGVVVFTSASLLNGLATTSQVLIGGRALQGLGAALVSPAALSIVTTTFAEGRERTRALGVWSAIAAGGGAVGLVVGGFLTGALSWRWVFFINLPIGIAAVLLAWRFVPNSRAEERPETVDVAGAVTVTAGLLVLVYDIVKAQQYGWTSGRTLGLAALAVGLLTAFVLIEHRSRAPLIRLGIFRIRSLTASNGAMLFVVSGLFAMFYFASLYVQDVLGYSPLKAGLAFLPVTAGIVIGAGLSQTAIKVMSARHVPLIGVALAAGGLFLLGRVPTHGIYLSDLLPGLLLMSIGMGLVFVPLTLIATTNIGPEDAGLASGLLNTTQQVGGALGLAILSTLATSRTNHVVNGFGSVASVAEKTAAQVDGYRLAFTAGAFLMLAAGIVVLGLLRRADVATIDAEEAVTAPV